VRFSHDRHQQLGQRIDRHVDRLTGLAGLSLIMGAIA